MGAPKPGRPRHPASHLVEALLAREYSERQIVAALENLGWRISRRTVGRIRDGVVRVSDSLLRPGEVRLAEPAYCRRGHRVTIWPCRTCTPLDELDRQVELRSLAGSQTRPSPLRPSASDGAAPA